MVQETIKRTLNLGKHAWLNAVKDIPQYWHCTPHLRLYIDYQKRICMYKLSTLDLMLHWLIKRLYFFYNNASLTLQINDTLPVSNSFKDSRYIPNNLKKLSIPTRVIDTMTTVWHILHKLWVHFYCWSEIKKLVIKYCIL